MKGESTMITIYSVSGEKLFTDRKEHFYIDADLLQEKAVAIRTQTILDRIARVLGYPDFDSLRTHTHSRGVTEETLMSWILSGQITTALNYLG